MDNIKNLQFKYELFDENEEVYCLYHVGRSRSIFIPFKVKIVATIYSDPDDVKYLVNIIDFYDSIPFLKVYFLFEPIFSRGNTNNQYLHHNLDEVSKILRKDKLLEILGYEYNVLSVDAMSCFKSETEMLNIYNEVHDFVCRDLIKELNDFIIRKSYKGLYRISNKKEFLTHNEKYLRKDMSKYEWERFMLQNKRSYNTTITAKKHFK